MNIETVKPKRGRKSKKDLLLSLNNEKNHSADIDNVILNVQEIPKNALEPSDMNVDIITNSTNEKQPNNIFFMEEDTSQKDNLNLQKSVSKKRGRKPKGGKIIQHLAPTNTQKDIKPNIILHLKCSLKDLQADNNNNIESFHFGSSKELEYNILPIQNDSSQHTISIGEIQDFDEDDSSLSGTKEQNMKDIYKKLKQLEQNLHINNINDKKSACFWCTYEFDNPAIYIPRYFLKNSYHVYGCFCSPECAVAHLMEENIDSSTKFERYHFINHLYAKIYNYNRNIKPAPNPYYMLEKYYGNLSIQEYRALFKNERLFLIVDKPLTRILPELHEDNDDFILNNKIIPSNNYQIKKKIQRKPQNKTSILNEKFGIV